MSLFHRQRKAVATETPPVPSPRPPFAVQSFGISDRGQVRPGNEDRFVIGELARTLHVRQTNLSQAKAQYSSHRGHVFLVADGMGGHEAGEVASGLSVESIEDFLLNTLKRFASDQVSEDQNALNQLQSALLQADARIFAETAKHPEWRGMGSTVTLAFAVDWKLFVAHAGDSRCYLFSKGELHQLTQDHTMVAELIRRGVLTAADAERSPFRHVVTNVLGGTASKLRVELHSLDLQPGDVLLLCSDGLTEMVADDQIAHVLRESSYPQTACERLVAEANNRGGKDNITVIVVHIGGQPAP